MTLPASGPISLNNVNVELGLSGTTLISMNQASVRTLFAVPSGAISMSNGYGKSNQFAFTISSNQTNANLRTLALNAGWPGTSKVVATINSGVYVSSNSTGTPALTVNGSFPGGVELINNGFIIGMGGGGGSAYIGFGPGTVGSAGGLALSVSSAITINNGSGTIGGGGGGGGGANAQYDGYTGVTGPGGGGGRSGAAANSAGGTGYFAPNGGAGTVSAPGAGGVNGVVSGGSGGQWGASGGASNTPPPAPWGTSRAGGAGGAAISGNANITYIATGTRLGAIS